MPNLMQQTSTLQAPRRKNQSVRPTTFPTLPVAIEWRQFLSISVLSLLFDTYTSGKSVILKDVERYEIPWHKHKEEGECTHLSKDLLHLVDLGYVWGNGTKAHHGDPNCYVREAVQQQYDPSLYQLSSLGTLTGMYIGSTLGCLYCQWTF